MDSHAQQSVVVTPRVNPQEPSWFVKAFTIIGFLIATIAVAYILTATTLLFIDPQHRFSLFGVYWGLFARFLQWSVRRGVRTNFQRYQDARMLGEQLFAFPVARRLVAAEILLSIIFLVLGFG